MKIYFAFFILLSVFLLAPAFASGKSSKTLVDIKLILNNASLKTENDINAFKIELLKDNKIAINDENIFFWVNEWQSLFQQFLNSQGYYAAEISYNIDNKNNNLIIYNIQLKEQYKIGNINIKLLADKNKEIVNLPSISNLELKADQPVLASKILDEQKKIRKFIEDNNCLLFFDVDHKALIDHERRKIDIIFTVEAGPNAYVNEIDFLGLKTIHKEYVRKIASQEIFTDCKDNNHCSCFKYSNILKAKEELQKTGLFANVEPVIPKNTDNEGNISVKFDVKERKHRTIKAGLKFSTDLGIGITGGYEHRNLFGSGEKLTTILSLTKPLQSLDSTLQIPLYLRDNQTLKLQNILKKEKLDAYDNKEVLILAGLEQKITDNITIGEGIRYGFNQVIDSNKKKSNYALLAIPLFGEFDLRDNILDPTKGGLVKLEFTPYINTINKQEKFYKTQLITSLYLSTDIKFKPVLALRGEIGSISGEKTGNLPANERFFGGGANSVRGYGYQTIGPLNDKKKPLGGNSMIEFSAELRLRVTEDIGIVGFIDAGNIFVTNTPKFKEKLLYASGIGLRYYTNFGPLRADIAFPMKKRPGVDKAFQLYFSIGQAF